MAHNVCVFLRYLKNALYNQPWKVYEIFLFSAQELNKIFGVFYDVLESCISQMV